MKKLLVELDALLDTRLGIIAQLSGDVAQQMVGQEAYHHRESDNWTAITEGRIDNEAFNQRWQQRDTEILKTSVQTDVILVLVSIINDYHKNRVDGLVGEDLGITINLYPYELDEEEITELADVVREVTYQSMVVDTVSLSHEDLTPAVLGQSYAGVIMYTFHNWLRRQGVNLTGGVCKGITLVGPRLFEEDISQLSKEDKQRSVTGLKLTFLEYLDIELIDARYFSATLPQ